jgi:hypothetical protein
VKLFLVDFQLVCKNRLNEEKAKEASLIEASLKSRIQGEFREMPGMRLTAQQAVRLFQIDPHVVDQLVDHKVLHRTSDGKIVAPRP